MLTATDDFRPLVFDDCDGCAVWGLKYHVVVRVVEELVPILGRGEEFDRTVEHAAIEFAKVWDRSDPRPQWIDFWTEYRAGVERGMDRRAYDQDNERRRVWVEHAEQHPTIRERMAAVPARGPVVRFPELPSLDVDKLDEADRLQVTETRYMASLLVLPHVSRFLHTVADMEAVVQDVTDQLFHAFECLGGTRLDTTALVGDYIQAVEHGAAARGPVWLAHAAALRERKAGHQPVPKKATSARPRVNGRRKR